MLQSPLSECHLTQAVSQDGRTSLARFVTPILAHIATEINRTNVLTPSV